MIDYELLTLNGKVYLNIWAPVMHLGRKVSFGEIRRCYNGVKFIEKKLQLLKDMKPNVKGWAIWVYHSKPEHKKQIEKLGATKLYDLEDRSWYVREVS